MADFELRHDLPQLRAITFDRAKRWWGGALAAKAISIAGALVLLWLGVAPILVVVVAAAVSIASDFMQMKSDAIKSEAESLHRKLEFQNSFGWALPPSEVRDVVARAPVATVEAVTIKSGAKPVDEFFASQSAPGERRAAENFLESAWWSQHQAESMSTICRVTWALALGLLLFILIAALASSAVEPYGKAAYDKMARIAVSSLLIVFSMGIFKLSDAYRRFGAKCEGIVKRLEELLKSDAFKTEDILKVIEDYHLARVSAPMFPTWLWRMRRDHLNRLWENYCPR